LEARRTDAPRDLHHPDVVFTALVVPKVRIDAVDVLADVQFPP
jgi:hypothetical protein